MEVMAVRFISFKQQMIWIGLGWLAFFFVFFSDLEWISKFLWPLYLINCLALVLVFFIGDEIYNSRRWLDLGLFNYQPSETLKVILTLLIANILAKRPLSQLFNFKDFLQASLIIIPPLVFVLVQPDLGTTGLSLAIVASLILLSGVEKKLLISLTLILLISTPLVWSFVLKPYQKSRITSFLNPQNDPKGAGYNVIQSKIAIGSGQFLGKGFKKGTQNKLEFLPERHTDFIFSVLSEEYGFVGSFSTVFLFFLLLSFIFHLSVQCRSRREHHFCMGALLFFLFHIILNLSMTMGAFPVVGIPLPLMSYGGSHMLSSMAFLGVVACVNKSKNLF